MLNLYLYSHLFIYYCIIFLLYPLFLYKINIKYSLNYEIMKILYKNVITCDEFKLSILNTQIFN